MPLSRMFAFAVRRGMIPANPVARLERGERPRVEKREKRILSSGEIAALLAHALPGYRTLLATAAYTGLRQSELLGLVWGDVAFDRGFVCVRKQLDRSGARVAPKTGQAVREVVLAPAVAKMLLEQRLASPFSGDADPVFANQAGRAFEHRNVQSRGFGKAAERAGINPAREKPVKGKPKRRTVVPGARRAATFHDLRHTFASLLISSGADVVHVSRQLGHADPSITLRVYADEFGAAGHADRTRALLDVAVGNALETTGGKSGLTGRVAVARKMAPLRALSSRGD